METNATDDGRYLLIESAPSVDGDLLAAVLDDEAFSVDVAQRKPAAAKLLEANSYDCLLVTPPDSQPLHFLKWIRARQPTTPIVVLLTTVRPAVFNWVALTPATHALWYEPTTATQTAEQIRRLQHDTELTGHLDQHGTLREAVLALLDDVNRCDTRMAIEETMCQRLAATELYTICWCGAYDAETQSVVPTTAAGIRSDQLAPLTVDERTLESVTIHSGDDAEPTTITVPVQTETDPVRLLVLTTSRDIDAVEHDLLATLGTGIGTALGTVDTPQESQTADLPPVQVFSQTVTHEFRNHLQTLRHHLEQGVPDQRAIENIDAVLNRIERLVTDAQLLTRKTLTADDRTNLELNELIHMIQERVPEYEQRVTILESIRLRGHPHLVELLCENLFRNSVEHAGDTAQIRVGALDDGFFIEDTGSGLPTTDHDALFEWPDADTETGGVGLAIVNRIVTIHGWEVTATDAANGGARFEISSAEEICRLAGQQSRV